MKSILLISLVLFLSCNDVWLDKQNHITADIYIIYSSGDGYRIARKQDASNYEFLIESNISELYKKDSILIVKALPKAEGSDTLFYKIIYKKLKDSNSVSILRKSEYDLLKDGQDNLIP